MEQADGLADERVHVAAHRQTDAQVDPLAHFELLLRLVADASSVASHIATAVTSNSATAAARLVADDEQVVEEHNVELDLGAEVLAHGEHRALLEQHALLLEQATLVAQSPLCVEQGFLASLFFVVD